MAKQNGPKRKYLPYPVLPPTVASMTGVLFATTKINNHCVAMVRESVRDECVKKKYHVA